MDMNQEKTKKTEKRHGVMSEQSTNSQQNAPSNIPWDQILVASGIEQAQSALNSIQLPSHATEQAHVLPHFEDITTVAIGEPSNTAARMQGKSRTSQQVKEESETMQEGQMSAQMASEQHHTSQSGCDQPKEKKTRMNWPDYAMDEAITVRRAKFSVPSSSLHDRLPRKKFFKRNRKGDSSESVEHEMSMVVPEKKRWGDYEVQDVMVCDQEESVKSLESHAGGRDINIVPSASSETLKDMNDHAASNEMDAPIVEVLDEHITSVAESEDLPSDVDLEEVIVDATDASGDDAAEVKLPCGKLMKNVAVPFSKQNVQRKYKWSEEDMVNAYKAVSNREMSQRQAAAHFKVPFWPLRNRLRGKVKMFDDAGNLIEAVRCVRFTNWSAEDMENAMRDVKENGMSLRKAAIVHGIPKSSLADRITGKRTITLNTRANLAQAKTRISAGNPCEISSRGMRKEITGNCKKRGRKGNSKGAKGTVVRKRVESSHENQSSFQETLLTDNVEVHVIDEMLVVGDLIAETSDIIVRENEKFAPLNGDIEETRPATPEDDSKNNLVALDGELRGSEEKAADKRSSERKGNFRGRVTMSGDGSNKSLGIKSLTRGWESQDMESAINDVMENGMSIRKSADAHGIPKSSLADRITRRRRSKGGNYKARGLRSTDRACEVCALRLRALYFFLYNDKTGCELLIAKLKPIATTDEEKAVIKSLEAGKMSPKAAARIFEVSFSRLRKVIASKSRMIAKDMEKEKTENSIEHEIDPQVCPEQVENIPGPANKNGFPAVRNSDQEAHPNEAVSSVNEADISTSQSNASEHLEKTECKVKRERMKWNFENLDLALGAVKDGKLSLRGAARFYGIPKSTLGDFIKGKRSSGAAPGPKRLLSAQEEDALAGWLITMANAGRHVKVKEVLETVKAILDKSGRVIRRLENNLPKQSWWYGFLVRHKEVAECRRNLKAEKDWFSYDADDAEETPEATDVTRRIQSLETEVKNLTEKIYTEYQHRRANQPPVEEEEQETLCGICNKGTIEEDGGEVWISCGTMGETGSLADGCGVWCHLLCSNLGRDNLSTNELKVITWHCPKCVS